MEIDKCPQTIIDIGIPLIDELIDKNEIHIQTGLGKPLGLTINLQGFLYKFYPYLDTYVRIKNIPFYESEFCFRGRQEEGVENWKLHIEIDGKKGFSPTNEFYEDTTTLSCRESEYGEISVEAKNSRKIVSNPFIKALKVRLPNNYLPEERQAITLDFNYMNLSGFPVPTFYKDFDSPLRSFFKDKVGISGYYYPVSTRKIHELKPRTWTSILEPTYLDAWGQWISQTFDVLSGRETVKSIASIYSKPIEKVEKHISQAKSICFELMLNSYERDDIYRWFSKRQLKAYRNLLFKKPVRALNSFANPKTINSHEVDELVNAYNEYAKAMDKPSITAYDICIKRYKPFEILREKFYRRKN